MWLFLEMVTEYVFEVGNWNCLWDINIVWYEYDYKKLKTDRAFSQTTYLKYISYQCISY